MRQINKDELYDNLREFLKVKGVNLQDGSYTRGIQAGCSFLADAINLSQAGLNRAKTEIERQLDNARKIIHEKTSPKGRTTGVRPKSRPGRVNTRPSGKNRGAGRAETASNKPKAKRNPGKHQ